LLDEASEKILKPARKIPLNNLPQRAMFKPSARILRDFDSFLRQFPSLAKFTRLHPNGFRFSRQMSLRCAAPRPAERRKTIPPQSISPGMSTISGKLSRLQISVASG